MKNIAVIIPAYNEEEAIANVIAEIPDFVNPIVVVNNNSTDNTAQVAASAGAVVLTEPRKGYGYACLLGINHINQFYENNDAIVFLDGDYSDFPQDLAKIVAPLVKGEVDFVVGARSKELRESGSMTPQQLFGNALATTFMRLLFGSTFTDLGPFRAIRRTTLNALGMQDKTYGWTVEMQLKVLKRKIPYQEVPVRYRNRIGVSKVSGTLKGTIGAGYKILGWIFKYAFK